MTGRVFLYNNYDFYEGNKVHWEHFYVGIFRCNQVLANVPAIEMDEVQKNQLLAQASFFACSVVFSDKSFVGERDISS